MDVCVDMLAQVCVSVRERESGALPVSVCVCVYVLV